MRRVDWHPFHEKPPPESGEYLCTDGMTVFLAWYHAGHKCFYESDGCTYFIPLLRVSHWMHKPRLPKTGGG